MTASAQRYSLIDLLKLILTVGIVLRHAELVGLEGRSAAFDSFSRGMMFVTEVCVPLFFVISGFLYFRNAPTRFDGQFFWKKTRSRLFSLLIPYLIANGIAFLCYWGAYRFAPEMMSGWLGDDWRKPLFIFWTGPVNLSLWFIRDLIIACITAPLIYLLVRYTRIWGVLALAALWFFVKGSPWYNLWFTLGAWVAVCQGDTADRLLSRVQCKVPADAAAWCFFIYLYHYIPMLVVKKLIATRIDPQGFWALLGCYLAAALFVLGLLSALYPTLKRIAPRLTNILIGGKL